jgi:Spy/CpxP family protein refolding chaperone
MKTTALTRILRSTGILALAAALGLQISPSAQAQPEPDRPTRPNPPGNEAQRGQPGGPEGFRGGAGPGQPLMEQVLTQDQRDSLRQTYASQREKMRGLQEKIRAARKALMTAALADEYQDEVVNAKALEVAKLEAEVLVLRLKTLSEVQPALSKEQLDKILNPPPPQGLGPDDGGNWPPNRNGNRQTPQNNPPR